MPLKGPMKEPQGKDVKRVENEEGTIAFSATLVPEVPTRPRGLSFASAHGVSTPARKLLSFAFETSLKHPSLQ